MSSKIKCRVLFVIGGKGGVGKSWLIALLAQWLAVLGIGFELFDCDDETSTTSRFFPGKARFLSIRSCADIDQLVQIAVEGAYQVVLVDLPARAGDEFQSWFGVIPWEELAELGVRFTGIGVIAGAKDSIECVLRWREFLGDHVDYVLALNRRDNLDIYLASRSRQQFLSAGVHEMELPKLDERFSAALDRANWTLSAALDATEAHLLTQIMSRARLRRYRDQVFSNFDQIKPLLLP